MPLAIAIEHRQGDFRLDAAFQVPITGITVLHGPSGAGKTTILKAIAGLLRPQRVAVDFSGARLDKLAPERRRVAMVFQDSRLFPHLSVLQNLLYGLRRVPAAVKRDLAGHVYLDETIALLGLQKLLQRRPAALSGGERQRVAIGRALLSQPRLLLMDEPLAALDEALQDSIMPYLIRLREAVSLPIIYVTHNMREVARLADHLVLLDQGRVLAEGPLSDLAARVDLPLARRRDAAGILTGLLHAHDDARALSAVAAGGQLYLVPRQQIPERTPVRLTIPAREVILTRDTVRGISVDNVIPAHVNAVAVLEDQNAALVELDVGGGMLLARITVDAADRLILAPGSHVFAMVQAMSVQTLT